MSTDNPFQPVGTLGPSEEDVAALRIQPSMEIGACFTEGARLWVKTLPPVALTVVVVTVVYSLATTAVMWSGMDFENQNRINQILGSLANAVQLGALGVVLSKARAGKAVSMGAAFVGGLTLCIPLMILNIPVGLAIVCGLLLLVLPGIYLAVRLCMTHVAYVLDPKIGIGGALQQSWRYTEGRFVQTFVLTLLNGAIAVVMMLLYVGAGLARGELSVFVAEAVPEGTLMAIDFGVMLVIDLVAAWPLMFTWFPIFVFYAGIQEITVMDEDGVPCLNCGSLQTEVIGGTVICNACGEHS